MSERPLDGLADQPGTGTPASGYATDQSDARTALNMPHGHAFPHS
ncbi:hypothetical protein [Ornithinimicrobium tianjinense]|nr:hypothetical protein [Ornithinimicrobium tianjinense]